MSSRDGGLSSLTQVRTAPEATNADTLLGAEEACVPSPDARVASSTKHSGSTMLYFGSGFSDSSRCRAAGSASNAAGYPFVQH